MLVATGQLRPSDLNKGRTKQGKSSDLFVEEVVINDAPMSARNFLTRSSTQEEISKVSLQFDFKHWDDNNLDTAIKKYC